MYTLPDQVLLSRDVYVDHPGRLCHSLLNALAVLIILALMISIETKVGLIKVTHAQETEPVKLAPQARLMTNPRVASMGGAGIGGSRATSALITNPAGMLSDASYVIDANYFRTPAEENLINFNVTDSQTSQNKFALGIGYQTNLTEGDFIEHHGQIGLAIPLFHLGSYGVLGGVNAHYLYQAADESDHFDIDLGVMVPVSQVLSIGIMGAQLLEDQRRVWGMGIGLLNKSFSGHLDLKRSFDVERFDVNAGLEWLLSDRFVIRGGYLHQLSAPEVDQEGPEAFTIGGAFLGLGSGKGRINFSYHRSLRDDEYIFGVGFSIYLDDRRQQMRTR